MEQDKFIELRNEDLITKNLKNSIEMIRLRNSWSNPHHFLGDNGFIEYNTFYLGAPRQMGRSSSIKKNFNHETDLYIADKLDYAKELIVDVIDIASGKCYFKFTDEQKEIIKKRKAYKSISYVESNYSKFFSEIPSGELVIYLDLCSFELDLARKDNKMHESYKNFVTSMIEYYKSTNQLEELYKKIVVIT